MHRRPFLTASAGLVGGALLVEAGEEKEAKNELNDVQSQLNSTRVFEVVKPVDVGGLAAAIAKASRAQMAVSISGGRHAMGGQQFGTGNLHVDTTSINRVLQLDVERGQVTVQAGIEWPELIAELHRRQPNTDAPWTIREKQTGVDAVTLGGSLSANIHGRGLKYSPLVQDVEAFDLVDGAGALRHCSRRENAELFALAIGGYGLFGIIAQVTLRLVRRFKVRRKVRLSPSRTCPSDCKTAWRAAASLAIASTASI